MSEQVRCNKCGYVGDLSEFPKGLDFFQSVYVRACPKCDNRQSPGGASFQAFDVLNGKQLPFERVLSAPPEDKS